MEGAGPTGERAGPAGRGDGGAAAPEDWGGVGKVEGGWGDGGVKEGEDEGSGSTQTRGCLIASGPFDISTWSVPFINLVGVSKYQF